MEDGVTEIKSFLPPLNLNPEDGSHREDDEEKKDGSVSTEKPEEDLAAEVEHKGKDSSAKGGIINNLISTLVSPMSPKTGNKATENESGNGVFNNSEELGGVTVDEDEERGGVVGNNNGEGGLISNFVSNFFHQGEGGGGGGGGDESVVETVKEKEDEDAEEVMVDEKIKRVKTEDGGAGGFIHNIVSHLPTSLPDDAVPTADEASILINSLVRD